MSHHKIIYKAIWRGDLTMIADNYLDTDSDFKALTIKSASKLLSMMPDNDFCNIFRIRNPETRRCALRQKAPFKQRRLNFL